MERRHEDSKIAKQGCIIHFDNLKINKKEEFVRLREKSTALVKLSNLQRIKEKRLQQSVESIERMQDACNKLPDRIDGLDLETTGWHRCCYNKFTKNEKRLQLSMTTSPLIPTVLFPVVSPMSSPSSSRASFSFGSPMSSSIGSPVLCLPIYSPTPDLPFGSPQTLASSSPVIRSPRNKGNSSSIFDKNICLFCNKKRAKDSHGNTFKPQRILFSGKSLRGKSLHGRKLSRWQKIWKTTHCSEKLRGLTSMPKKPISMRFAVAISGASTKLGKVITNQTKRILLQTNQRLKLYTM